MTPLGIGKIVIQTDCHFNESFLVHEGPFWDKKNCHIKSNCHTIWCHIILGAMYSFLLPPQVCKAIVLLLCPISKFRFSPDLSRAFADLHGCAELKEQAEKFAETHFAEVLDCDEYLALDPHQACQSVPGRKFHSYSVCRDPDQVGLNRMCWDTESG